MNGADATPTTSSADECSALVEVPPAASPATDEVDRPSPRANISKFDISLKWLSFLLPMFDSANDLTLILTYLTKYEWSNGAWTAGFHFGSSCILTVVSMRMYNQEVEKNPDSRRGPASEEHNKTIWRKYWWPMVLYLQLAPMIRNHETLDYATNSRDYGKKGDWNNQNKNYKKMLKEDQDIALLRIIEASVESAPQLILQFAIMQADYPQPTDYKFFFQVAKILFALVSLGWCMTSYDRSVRLAQPDKTIITKLGLVVQFCRHFMITVSRIIAVALIASVWPLYTCIWFIVHWAVMTIWISTTSTAPTAFVRDRRRDPHLALTFSENIKSKMFASVLGIVFFFTYVNIIERPTFVRLYSLYRPFYYIIYIAGNITACYYWYAFATEEIANRWYFMASIVLCIVSFLIGIVCMIVYYQSSSIMKKQDLETPSNNSSLISANASTNSFLISPNASNNSSSSVIPLLGLQNPTLPTSS